MKRLALAALIVILTLSTVQNVFAQGELVLSINRDFGYGGFDNKIEGLFSLSATGPEDLERVDFYIDEELIDSVNDEPFEIQFSTSRFSPGEHRLHATGFTLSDEQIQSNVIVRVFLTKEESRNAVTGIIFPMLGFILLLIIATAGLPALFGRKEKFGEYGVLGGTVCPKCGLPFSLKLTGFNWLGGKLQRCPHCGKWSVVNRASPDALAVAEARYRGEDPSPLIVENKEQRVKRQIDDSRYID